MDSQNLTQSDSRQPPPLFEGLRAEVLVVEDFVSADHDSRPMDVIGNSPKTITFAERAQPPCEFVVIGNSVMFITRQQNVGSVTVSHLTETAVRTTARSVSRGEIRIEESYQNFRSRYEAAVPPFEPERVAALAAVVDILKAAGDGSQCTEYLMGNHTIAEQMYRHHPGALMSAPPRTTIYETAVGDPFFGIDRPATP
jgi:hypothetical protein